MGIVIFSTGNDDVNSLMRKSDTAMYEAKKSGKNSCYHYQDE
jgi:PleD family two-component response regulator